MEEIKDKNNTTVNSVEDMGGGPSSIGLGEGQSLIPSPVLKKKKEADEAYYNEGSFDDDQLLAIEILKDQGQDVSKYITPDNSPEQMIELGNSISLGIPAEKLKILANPEVSFMAIQTINKAWNKRIDLTRYLPWADPFVLNQAYLGALKGLDLDRFIKPGLDHRQIEQLRKTLEEGGNPEELTGNYNQMRMKRFPGSDISNTLTHTPKGQGISTHNKRRPNPWKK